MKKTGVLAILVCVMAVVNVVSAEMVRGINIDFVTIDNLGNQADSTGYGAADYMYQIGKYEITNAQWNAFIAIADAPSGGAGGYNFSSYDTGDQQPTTCVSWYETAQFCNYLTSGDKSKGAYQFSGSNAYPGNFLGINRTAAQTMYGTIYVIPTEDEWYKAAYYTGGYSPRYSLYANGTDTAPIPAVDTNYLNGKHWTWDVGSGTKELNGTYDMMGNVWERTETLYSGLERVIRGGSYADNDPFYIKSTSRYGGQPPDNEPIDCGFRVVSIIPEPCTLLLLGLGGLLIRKR